ncbi:MAG: hypothetical protein HQK54_12890, partial [Oligoflexales bacterium]|nr:hypothetical protein [Oligoflexales bacterium]
ATKDQKNVSSVADLMETSAAKDPKCHLDSLKTPSRLSRERLDKMEKMLDFKLRGQIVGPWLKKEMSHVISSKERAAEAVRVIAAQARRVLDGQTEGLHNEPVDGQTYLQIRHMPHRGDQVPEFSKEPAPFSDSRTKEDCPLCSRNNLAADFVYGDRLRIISNVARYADESILIKSRDHMLQTDIPSLLPDVCEFIANMPPKYFFFFNGLAGNSQRHTHFQAISETAPIREAINSQDLRLKETASAENVSMGILSPAKSFDVEKTERSSDHFCGYYFNGDFRTVASFAGRFLEALDQSRERPGLYNLFAFRCEESSKMILIVVPRTSPEKVALMGRELCALDYAGFIGDYAPEDETKKLFSYDFYRKALIENSAVSQTKEWADAWMRREV